MRGGDDTDPDSLVRWPFDADGWLHTVLVGTLLVATLPLVVPSVLLAGYAVRVLRADADDPLPDFADCRALAATGARAAAIVVAYHLPVVLLAVVGLGARIPALVRGVPPAALRPTGFAALGPSVAFSSAVAVAAAATLPLCGYVATVAVTAYATTDEVTAAFDRGRIRRRAWSRATLRAWLLGALVTVGTGVVAFLSGAVTAAIPGVGLLLVGAVRFYGGTVALRGWSAWRPADQDEPATGAETRTNTGTVDTA